ncbi:MAG: glycoside hydrolase family 9 protein [Fibrobacter sp.]|nr:glycoside hydrolase family 9 protein [Fibrobacter sp.]
MRNVIKAVLLLMFFAVDFALADNFPNIDRTDKVHSRRYLDSINVYHRRAIRVNQAGFRPQDPKYAYVADPKENKYKVIDANSGAEAWSGSLSLIQNDVVKPGIWVNGVFNSSDENWIYRFGDTTTSKETESLYRADFSSLNTQGEYYLVVGNDTSATFHINSSVFNAIFENSLKFFGAQRCGNTNSHFHAPCHLKDGSAVGHDLSGGWHDCGDHFKVSETLSYAAYALSTIYLVYKEKAEDRYGNSYNDTVIVDGYPDVLYEAKIGADYIYKLYKASKADGLIEKHDMYHSVGVDIADHSYWDLPERQDAQPASLGGPDRVVLKGVGTQSGMFVAALAYFAAGWAAFEPVYAEELLEAAKDIYENVLLPNTPAVPGGDYKTIEGLGTFYPGEVNETNKTDDAAAAALALWYATKDTIYQYHLYKDTSFNNNAINYINNNDPEPGPYFRGGFLGLTSGFYPGGWVTDFENVHAYVLFSFIKLILSDKDTALSYNVSALDRDTLLHRATNCLRRLTDDGTLGSKTIYENRFGSVKAQPPYNLVYTNISWGLNRYNLGAANAVFMLSEVLPDGPEKEAYFNLALDNIYYSLGANPWDISFLMGAGERNENHPHNRAANPDGYNAGGIPYEYRCPLGALMGGIMPTSTLEDNWSKWDKTETCIDFSVQLLVPAQRLAEVLPPDTEGPLFSNIAGTPITETSAIVSWDANEIALVTVFYNTTPEKTGAKSVQQTKASKGGSIILEGLEMGQTYYFFLEGMDPKHNITTDDNHGQWYQFTMTNVKPKISGVTICQVDNRSAKIYWWTDIRSNGVVNYGTSMSALNEAQASSDGAVLFHEVTLTNLKAGTTYYFTVSSGMSDDNNGGSGYSFTTESEATYADLAIFIKPSSYQAECTNWEDCYEFWVSISNSDTMSFHDFDVRLYLGDNPNIKVVDWARMTQNWKGNGQMTSIKDISYGTPQMDGSSYYLPVTIKDTLDVSGRMIFQLKFETGTYKDFADGWSIRPHVADDDPEYFEGVDLKQGPYFNLLETSDWELDSIGERVVAYVRDPYVTVYYHGKHIFGYGPEDTPESGPQVHRTVTLDFEKPFRSPYYSIEKEDYKTTYEGSSKVTPTGILDDLEMNGKPQNFVYDNGTRTDSYVFAKDTTLAYGNNYMEWVSWHNHAAGMPGYTGKNQYDCACAVVRSNVEIDTITTPLEKRYLSFNKDVYTTYRTSDPSNPKRVEVHVYLLDSLAQLLDTVSLSLELGTTSGNVLFWSSKTATIPVTSIQLVNGEAVFYVSSEEVLVTTLFAKAAGTSTQFDYDAAYAKLNIEELPPWPIIDVAKMVDTNCDNVPDAIEITLSNEYQEKQSFKSVSFVYGTDTITTTDVISLSGRDLVVKANITDTAINTDPSGSITLYSNVNGSVESHTDFYQDGVAPTLLAVAVLERLDTAKSDRVYMQFSEPISAPGTDWPVQLFATNGTTKVNEPSVKFSQIYNESMNVWEFEVEFDANGNSVVTEGMFAQLLANGAIKDKNGNEVSSACGQPKLPITLKLLPVPMTYASISDNNEDGYAEYIYIEYERPIDSKHQPDSLSIVFGIQTPETLWVAGSVPTYAADGMTATLSLPSPFSYGVTGGTYEGPLKGMNVTGAGLVAQHLGSGASYEMNSVLGQDLVGPVIVAASIDMSKSDKFDFLALDLSEPVSVTDSSLVYYREKISGSDTAIYKHSVQSLSVTPSKLGMQVYYDKKSPLAVSDGDYVRLQPKDFSALRDALGNMPATDAPWIPIMSSGDPKIKFVVTMQNEAAQSSVARSGGDLRTQVPAQDNMRLYVLNPTTRKLDLIRDGQVIAQGIDTTGIQGAIWKIEMTVPRGSAGGEPAAWDSLRVKYDMPIYSNLGSFVNRLSGKYIVPSAEYLSSSGKVIFYVEWANTQVGIQSEKGRAVATGAYIYKLQMETVFIANPNSENADKFSNKNSYDKTSTFGVKRVK